MTKVAASMGTTEIETLPPWDPTIRDKREQRPRWPGFERLDLLPLSGSRDSEEPFTKKRTHETTYNPFDLTAFNYAHQCTEH